jgi:hypothetical protein
VKRKSNKTFETHPKLAFPVTRRFAKMTMLIDKKSQRGLHGNQKTWLVAAGRHLRSNRRDFGKHVAADFTGPRR